MACAPKETTEFTVDETRGTSTAAFSLSVYDSLSSFTLLGRLSESPDWFVGVENVSLIEDGVWLDKLEAKAFVYDGGTVSGGDFGTNGEPEEEAHVASLLEHSDFPVSEKLQPTALAEIYLVERATSVNSAPARADQESGAEN